MKGTETSNRIRDAFLDAVKSFGGTIETMNDLASKATIPNVRQVYERLGQSGRNVYLIHGVGLINIHVRSEPPGWWNVLKTVKEDFDLLRRELGIETYFLLLIGRSDRHVANGYIASDFTKSPVTRHPGIEGTKFTINERQHLDPSKRLLSVEQVAKILLEARRPV